MSSITLCQANGDQALYEQISDELRSMGYPISATDRVTQIACGPRELRPQGTDPERELYDRILRQCANAPTTKLYFDNEYPGHDSYRGFSTPSQLAVRDALMTHAHESGKLAGFWGEPGVWTHSDNPVSAIAVGDCRRQSVPADLIFGNAYLRRNLVDHADAMRMAGNVALWCSTLERGLARIDGAGRASRPELYVAFQLVVRPPRTQARWPITADDAQALGRTHAMVTRMGHRSLWWFELGPGIDTMMSEASEHADAFLSGWDSIGLYGQADAGRPQGND